MEREAEMNEKSHTRISGPKPTWRERLGFLIAGKKYRELLRDKHIDSYEIALRECYNICVRHQVLYKKRGETEGAEAAMYISNSIHAKMASM